MFLNSNTWTRSRQLSFVLCVLIILSAGVACQRSAPEEKKTTETKTEKIVFRNEDEAKAFVAANLEEPIPPGYKIPAYITSELPRDQVYDSLRTRYPNFYGKQRGEYLKAIMADPETYLKLSLESKAIRRYYDPNSKY